MKNLHKGFREFSLTSSAEKVTKFLNLWHCSAVLAGFVSFIFGESELYHFGIKYFFIGVSGLSRSDCIFFILVGVANHGKCRISMHFFPVQKDNPLSRTGKKFFSECYPRKIYCDML